jgi:hypothetical protein
MKINLSKLSLVSLLLVQILPLTAALGAFDLVTDSAAFTSLRMNFAKQDAYDGGWVSNPLRETLLKTYDENKPDTFIKDSEAWLKQCPVDAKVHLMRASLLMKKDDFQGHFYHRMMYYGLMTSIVSSGDGKSPKTAYKVISVDEEYTFLNHIGAKLKRQSLKDGPSDEMEVDIEGTPTVIYFNVAIPFEVRTRGLDK